MKKQNAGNGHFSSSYDNRLKAFMAPGVSAVLRPPDEYPWEINIGHLSLASVVHLEDSRYDNEIQVLNCRMRYVMIRSDSMDENTLISTGNSDALTKPFVETQISFRTDSVEGSIDTTVIDQIFAKIDFGGVTDLPLPALFNKVKSKMKERQQRMDLQRKMKKERLQRFKEDSETKADEDRKEDKRLAKQQERRTKLLKHKKSTLDASVIANDVLLSHNESVKHADVREIDLSDSDGGDDKGGKHNKATSSNGVDLDSFIEGILDGIGGGADDSSSDTDIDVTDNKTADIIKDTTPTPSVGATRTGSKSNLISTGSLIPSDGDISDSESMSSSKKKKKDENATEYRLILYSNLDRGEFQITNNGITQLKGKTRSQQLLVQWTQDILNFHFFSTELKLYESPIGKYQEHDVVTRFSRARDGRMWSEVVHDEPDGHIELTYPPSLQRVVDKNKLSINDVDNGNDEERAVVVRNGNNKSNEKKEDEAENLKRDKQELMDLVRYITLENRVMQTKVLQLASDLSVARDDMKRFVKQTSEDKIRIVEHQQYLINDNMELQKQVQSFKKRIRELELARNYTKKQ